MQNIHICMVCDNDYIIPTSVAVQSILDTISDNNLYFFHIIVSGDIGDVNIIFSNMFANKKNAKFEIIQKNADELFDGYHKFKEGAMCVASIAALLKFLIPEIFPNLDKILYLDGDILVSRDIAQIYETNIDDYYAGVVIDSGSLYGKNVYISQVEHYFNSGVMLLNLKRLREHNISQKLIETKKLLSDSSLMDQNIFNLVFNKHVLLLPIEYNFLGINLRRAFSKWTIEQLNKLYNTNYDNKMCLFGSQTITHFASKSKPWKFSNVLYGDKWYSIYQRLFNEPLEREYGKGVEFLASPKNFGIENPVIVSLTTIPSRINLVYKVIENVLYHQNVKIDKVILYVSDIAENEIPISLKSLLSDDRFEICIVDDIGPHRKYFYTMQNYPNAIVITIDDDIYYPFDMISVLLKSYCKYPYAVSARRAHLIEFDENGNIKPYKEWKMCFTKINEPTHALLATTGAGTLFPPFCINQKLFDLEMIKKTCLKTDDLWLKVVEVLSNVPVVIATNKPKLFYIDGSQEIALWKSNVIENKNDVALNNIFDGLGKTSAIVKDKIYFSYKKVNLNSIEVQAQDIEKSIISLCAKSEKLTHTISNLDSNLEKYASLSKLQSKLDSTRNSASYKIGRFITWIPRFIRRKVKGLK